MLIILFFATNNTTSSSNISRISKKKRNNYSFTNDYFERAFDPTTGEELHICNILDKNGRCCKKTYKSFGYSNGNLKRHLDEVHGINEVEIVDERKKVRIYVISYLIFLIF